jgi:hypothetical protein
MLLHEILEFADYPIVRSFLEHQVSMQFGDVREMLRLPLPSMKMTHACNFAATNTLCSIISGISVSIYKPSEPARIRNRGNRERKENVGTGFAFKRLLTDFYPWGGGQDPEVLSKAVYDLLRNPLAHALGVQKVSSRIEICRLRLIDGNGMNQETGLTEEQIEELEQLTSRPLWALPGLAMSGNSWKLLVEGFYRDSLEMIQKLSRNPSQMSDAEDRFRQRKWIWQ